MRLNRIAAVFYCLIKCRLVQSRQNFRVIESASVAIPVSKVRGIYSVLHSDGLPRSLCSLAMTNFASSFGGSVGDADDRGLYVILSASEISHRKSDNVYFRKIIFKKTRKNG